MNSNEQAAVNQTAYNTNVTRGLLAKTLTIATSIETLLMIDKDNDDFSTIGFSKTGLNGSKVICVRGDVEKIPTFLHPIIYKNTALIDIRAYVNKNKELRNYYDYTLLARRALLDLAWVDDKEIYYGQENFIIDAFSSWFSYGLQRNTNTNLLTATNYRVIAAIYYLGLFSNDHIIRDDDVIAFLLKRIPRLIAIPAQFIDDLITVNETAIIDLYRCGTASETLNRVATLATALTALTDDTFKIDTGIIYNSLCRGAFIAANAVEISSIAIEHPPTLVAMMYCVTQKGLQTHTNLGKAVAGIARKYDKDNFDRFISEVSPLE